MAETLGFAPLSLDTAIVEKDGTISRAFNNWLLSVITRVAGSASVSGTVSLPPASGALAPTSVLTAPTTGLYRINYYGHITQAATSSSSLAVSVTATDGGLNVIQTTAPVTGNNTTVALSGVLLVRADGATPITVSTVYASSGATPMAYALSITVEALG